MYLDFYKLKEFPFAMTCDEKFFFESEIHGEALANMMYTVQQRKGMVLVTGEVGTGKTFVSSILARRLGPGCLTVQMRKPPQSPKQLIRGIAANAGLNTSESADMMSLVDDLEKHLERMRHRGRLVSLILDEAQDLSADSLEELRLLWNWESNGQRLIEIVLIGQPELRDRLLEQQWEPLRQRIVLSYHLGHLSFEDASAYVDHRLRIAAGDGCEVTFAPEAKQDIFAATNGVPRLINILCDNALLVGYVRGTHDIDRAIMNDVVRDMQVPGSEVNESGRGGGKFSALA